MNELANAKKIMGIDASTYVGIVQLGEPEAKNMLIHFPEEYGPFRLQLIAKSVGSVLDQWTPDAVVIESYSMQSQFNLVQMVEIGTLIRRELFLRKIPWFDCAPTTLKLWCAGSGRADKPRMAEAVKERWDFVSPSDDVIDAYALAKLGEHVGIHGLTPNIKGFIKWDTKPSRKKKPPKSKAKPKGV